MSADDESVTLISNDGYEFVMKKSACMTASGMLRRTFDTSRPFAEAAEGRCVLEDVNGLILEHVCRYLNYHEKNKGKKDVPDMDIPPELCLELLMTADYLEC